MRAFLDGKLYDTETAQYVAQWDNGRDGDELHGIVERIYRTDLGSWFLVGDGGAATEYAHATANNNTIGGAQMIALSPEEALDWLQTHNLVEAVEQYFPDSIIAA